MNCIFATAMKGTGESISNDTLNETVEFANHANPETKNEIMEQIMPFHAHFQLPLKDAPVRGFRNTFNNCWLNSVLQLVLGTSMQDSLPAAAAAADISVEKTPLSFLLRQVAQELQQTSLRPIEPDYLTEIASQLQENPDLMEHIDVSDGFIRLCTQITEESTGSSGCVPLKMKTATLQYCGRCKCVGGKIKMTTCCDWNLSRLINTQHAA